MPHPDQLRDEARELRADRDLTIDQIAARLALSRSTVYCWVRELPIERPPRKRGQGIGSRALSEQHPLLREKAYAEGAAEFDRLAQDPSFRDFVCMYIGEGSKRERSTVSICNSDPAVIVLGAHWIGRLSETRLSFGLQFHADQDVVELVRFWAGELGVDHDRIRLQCRSSSNQLDGRARRSRYGVLTVVAHDVLLRSRLQAWMDRASGMGSAAPFLGR